jgi:uncharacterized membrane protein YczE
MVPFIVALDAHSKNCNRIIRLGSFHVILIGFFICFWHHLSAKWTSLLQTLLYFTILIGMITAGANALAAA